MFLDCVSGHVIGRMCRASCPVSISCFVLYYLSLISLAVNSKQTSDLVRQCCSSPSESALSKLTQADIHVRSGVGRMKHGSTALVAKCDSLCPAPSSYSMFLCMPKTTFRWATYTFFCIRGKLWGEIYFPFYFYEHFIFCTCFCVVGFFLRPLCYSNPLLHCAFIFMGLVFFLLLLLLFPLYIFFLSQVGKYTGSPNIIWEIHTKCGKFITLWALWLTDCPLILCGFCWRWPQATRWCYKSGPAEMTGNNLNSTIKEAA